MIKAIDLFSGCGGVSCGLTKAGFSVKVAVEIEESAKKIYLNYPPLGNVNVLCEDIRKISGRKLLKEANIEPGELYLFAGCPPCQNFSRQNIKNKTKSYEERKELLFEFLKIIEDIYPPFVLMENVPGIKADAKAKDKDGNLILDVNGQPLKTNKDILDEFLSRLRNESGADNQRYKVFEKVLNAADYGVPQFRKRYVLHAVRYDIYLKLHSRGIEFGLPIATHNKKGDSGLQPWKTVKQTIGDLPEITAGEEFPDNIVIHNHKCANLSPINLERMEAIRNNGGSRTGLPERLVLKCHKKVDDKGNMFAGRKDVYGIMESDKPSPTITGGCLCYSKGRYGHYSQNRAISIREAARLQTFPDDFVFSNNLGQAALQIGNAVPVKLVEASGQEFYRCIKALAENTPE